MTMSITENALKILQARYLLRDPRGQVVETPEELFRRVAHHVAQAETHFGNANAAARWEKVFHDALVRLDFLPNSPTLMNAGTPLGQLSACFAAGTMIDTFEGPCPIETVEAGTFVLTHQGRYRPVTATMHRVDKLCRVKIDKLPPMFVTAEHPILTSDGWVRVKDLKPKSHFARLGMPRLEPEPVRMAFDGEARDGWVYAWLEGTSPRSLRRYTCRDAVSRQVSPIRDQVELDEDIGWLLGLYLAEGSVSRGYHIRFALSWDEEEHAQRLVQVLANRLGLQACALHQRQPANRRGDGWITVRVCSKQLAHWLIEHIGTGFDQKRLPVWTSSLAPEVRRALLQGVADGDGTPINAHQTRIALCNEVLVRQLFTLALGLGYFPTLAVAKVPTLGTTEPWSVAYGDTYNTGMVRDGAYRVLEITPLDAEAVVYNIEVEEDHTYVANQIVVHNCFVLPVEDSIEGIFGSLRLMALIQKSGGGTGFSFSHLRPKGDMVASTGGAASGPVSFMHIFDCATEGMWKGGKRHGANMGVLRVDHLDIAEFIEAKLDGHGFRNFNISVGVTDAFMEAALAGQPWTLCNPRTGQPARSMPAAELLDRIVHAAWQTGDPGLLFLDAINRANPTPELGTIEATNPCVPGDTWVHTDTGPRQVRELVGSRFRAVVDAEIRRSTVEGFFPTGEKLVYRITTDRGYCLECTADHPLPQVHRLTRYIRETRWLKLADLQVGDKLVLQNHRGMVWAGEGTFEQGWLLGSLVGDGVFTEKRVRLSYWGETKLFMRMLARERLRMAVRCRADAGGGSDVSRAVVTQDKVTLGSVQLRQLAERFGISPEKSLGSQVERSSYQFHRGFLQGWFDADGTVGGNQKKGVSVRLASSDREKLRVAQRMLARLGILSTVYVQRHQAGYRELPDGQGGRKLYFCQEDHELVITGDNLLIFDREVGFSDPDKDRRLRQQLANYRRKLNRERFLATIVSITPIGVRDVYDCTIPGIGQFDGNGFALHNCGEVPLLPYEACNLSSINLSHMVCRKGAGYTVDWQKLSEMAHLAIRFLDDVIEVSRWPAPEITSVVRGNRKVGLGFMGFAELLILLGIPYASERAVTLAEELMRCLSEQALAASQQLAQERGVFPNWERSIYARQGLRLRNATRTSIAPTGTISILAGTSASIEPLFALAYRREHVLGEQTLTELNPLLLRYAQQHGFYSEQFVQELQAQGTLAGLPDVPPSLKELFQTALEIAPEAHLRIQAAFQKHTDNAVSKTINLPHEATVEDVAAIYRRAWEWGCKGITVFRYGSKGQQVLELGVGETAAQHEHFARCDPQACKL